MCKQKRQLQEGARESRFTGQCGIVVPSCTGLTWNAGLTWNVRNAVTDPTPPACLIAGILTRAQGIPMQIQLEQLNSARSGPLPTPHARLYPLTKMGSGHMQAPEYLLYSKDVHSREFSEGDLFSLTHTCKYIVS